MAKEIVTLYIDDSCVRLLVTRGKQIKKWADLPLEPGLVKNRVVIKEAEVSNKVKQLFKVLKVRSKKVVVGVSGLNCLTRPISFPHIPGELLEEAVMREAKRTLPVPPEQLYLSWQTIPAPPGKTQVFLVAIPQKMADAMLKTLRGAGLKPYLMELKPLALARATKEATSIIVDVQPAEFDIVITDPPRSGLTGKVINNLLSMMPGRIVYISCNPTTLARDLKKLAEKYDIESVRLVDFFPQTYHIEALVFLILR